MTSTSKQGDPIGRYDGLVQLQAFNIRRLVFQTVSNSENRPAGHPPLKDIKKNAGKICTLDIRVMKVSLEGPSSPSLHSLQPA